MRNKQDGSSALKAELATLRRRVQTLETQLHEQERSSQGLKAAIGERTSQPQGSGRALDNQTKGLSKARDAFREGREMPQAIMNAPDDFVVVLNSDGVIIEANKAIAQQFGMNCEALVGCSAWDLFRDEIAEPRMTALESACGTGQAVRFEDEREGRYYDHVVYPIVGPEGTAHKAVVITRDMTQQKQEEDSLRKSEERYRTITQHANDAIVVVQDGKTVYRNPVYEEMVGYTVTETANQSFFDVIAPKDRKRVREYYEKRLKGRNVPERYEVDVITRDGKGIAIEVKASIIEYHGKKASMAVMRDVTERKKAEEALRQSEARLRTAIESLPFDFFVIDESGHYVMQNSICKQRWGDVIGKRPEDLLVDQHNLPLWLENNRRAFSGETVRGEIELIIDDETGYYDTVVSPIYDGDRVTSILGINIDVTKRKKAEEALRKAHDDLERKVEERTAKLHKSNTLLKREIVERKRVEEALRRSEVRFRELTELLPETIFEMDVTGKVTYVNRSGFDRFGYDRQDFDLGLNGFDMIAPEDRKRAKENFQEILRGEKIGLSEYKALRKDGSTFPVMLHSNAISRDGEPVGIRGFLLDITDRKEAENALGKSEERFRDIAYSMADWIWEVDEKGAYTYCSEKVEGTLGYPIEQIIGKTPFDFMPSDEAERTKEMFFKLARNKEPIRDMENWNISKGGQLVCLLTSGVPVLDEKGGLKGYRGVDKDITERKRFEEALRKREGELEIKSINLEEANAALRVLLKKRDDDRTELEEKVLSNVKDLIFPYLEKLKHSALDDRQMEFARILESNVNDIISPFSRTLSSKYLNLTPAELEVANLVKQGKTSKDIAELLNVSSRTVETHRDHIRRKLGLRNKKANLRTHLLSIQ